jgi:hypothetical protein
VSCKYQGFNQYSIHPEMNNASLVIENLDALTNAEHMKIAIRLASE